MIKVGLSGKAPDFVNLVRMLKAHPDCEIAWIVDNGRTARVSNIYPELVGEYTGSFDEEADLEAIDVYIGPYDRRLETAPETLRMIVTGPVPSPDETALPFVHALPEYNRKTLVRGARCTYFPDMATLPLTLALMPAAKNLLLRGPVTGAVILSNRMVRYVDIADGRYLSSAATGQACDVLASLQTSFSGEMNINAFAHASDVVMATLNLPTTMSLDEIAALYHGFYDDHRHVVLLENPVNAVSAAMVAGTYKAVVSLVVGDGVLHVTVALDAASRLGSGMAVHLLDLLFGLHELTGF